MFDPGGGEGECVNIVGLVGEGFLQAGSCEGLGGVGNAVALQSFHDGLKYVHDVVGFIFRGCLGRGADGMMVGDGESNGCIGQPVRTRSLGVFDIVEVDEAARPLNRWLWHVELVPVLVDVMESRNHSGEPVLDGKEYLFHRELFEYLNAWVLGLMGRIGPIELIRPIGLMVVIC